MHIHQALLNISMHDEGMDTLGLIAHVGMLDYACVEPTELERQIVKAFPDISEINKNFDVSDDTRKRYYDAYMFCIVQGYHGLLAVLTHLYKDPDNRLPDTFKPMCEKWATLGRKLRFEGMPDNETIYTILNVAAWMTYTYETRPHPEDVIFSGQLFGFRKSLCEYGKSLNKYQA